MTQICSAVGKAVRKAHRPERNGQAVAEGHRARQSRRRHRQRSAATAQYRFNQRQLLYALRPIVRSETGQNLQTDNFKTIITDYEAEHGEIPGMYREPRGSIYHPHRGETITLGTLMVEDYERPVWTFNKVVYIEKEGFGRRR